MPGHRVVLHEPRIDGREAAFSWDVSPETELYRRSGFQMSFPEPIDLSAVPRALWWRIMLLCLHGHWARLRPCRVELPISLDAGEREFWLRLVDNADRAPSAHLRATRPVELVDDGPPLHPAPISGRDKRPVVAFGGDIESLVLAGLASELAGSSLLVSAIPAAYDPREIARVRTGQQLARRLGAETIEVRTDFETATASSVRESSQPELQQAVAITVAAACGSWIYLDSVDDGMNVSRAATQAALGALLARFGLRQGSLTYPLDLHQLHALLLHRYRELAGIQRSCRRAPPGALACSECRRCFELALLTLSDGAPPSRIGIDPISSLLAFGDWHLGTATGPGGPLVIRCLQATPMQAVTSILAADAAAAGDPRLGEALAIYARLRADALQHEVPPAPGYISGFLELAPDELRGRLRAILDQHFTPAGHEFDELVAQSRAVTAWIAQPLRDRAHSKHPAAQMAIASS